MAKKRAAKNMRKNMSATVRDYLEKNPDAMESPSRETAEATGTNEGIVNQVKGQLRAGKKAPRRSSKTPRKRRPTRQPKAKVVSKPSIVGNEIVTVKQADSLTLEWDQLLFVSREFGGIEATKKALDVLAQMLELEEHA